VVFLFVAHARHKEENGRADGLNSRRQRERRERNSRAGSPRNSETQIPKRIVGVKLKLSRDPKMPRQKNVVDRCGGER
jgi:hypothetical protein